MLVSEHRNSILSHCGQNCDDIEPLILASAAVVWRCDESGYSAFANLAGESTVVKKQLRSN
jgi:hypothetical protein